MFLTSFLWVRVYINYLSSMEAEINQLCPSESINILNSNFLDFLLHHVNLNYVFFYKIWLADTFCIRVYNIFIDIRSHCLETDNVF